MDFYLETAKMRAGRILWERIIDEFGAMNPRSAHAAHTTARLPDGR